jgi:ankyrin repeat protein
MKYRNVSTKFHNVTIICCVLFFLTGCVTAPIFMVNTNNLQGLKNLDPSKVDERLLSNPTALWQAASIGKIEYVKVLIEKGADVNTTHQGAAAILQASFNQHSDIVELLVNSGANINTTNQFGTSALLFAIAKNAPKEHIDFLLNNAARIDQIQNENGNISNPLTVAISNNRVDMAKLLVERGADINTPIIFPPIVRAAQSGNIDLIEYLLTNGADIDAIGGTDNSNSLVAAIGNQHWRAANFLLKEGINIEYIRPDGFTALHFATTSAAPVDLVQQLIEKKLDINARNKNSDTALILATYHNNTSHTDALINAGADINLKNNNGETPLHFAIHHSNFSIARKLVERGASIYSTNLQGQSPYSMAQLNPALVNVLMTSHQKSNQGPVTDAKPSVISSQQADKKTLRIVSTGSGFFINDEAQLVTNHHVIEQCAALEIRVNNKSYASEVTVFDSKNDLAVLSSEAPVATYVKISEEQNAALGEQLTVLGYPLNSILGNSLKLTTGILSAQTGISGNSSVYQISAPIQSGNSGGPVFDEMGNLVGVAVSTLDPLYMAKNTGSLPQNVNYAVKSSVLLGFLNANSIAYSAGDKLKKHTAKDVNAKFGQSTVLISCLDYR